MAHQTITAFDPVTHSRLCDDRIEIVELLHVRVVSERVSIGEALTIIADATSGKIESDGAKAGVGQPVSQMRKKGEVREPLEAVTDHDRSQRLVGKSRLTPYDQRSLISAIPPQLELVDHSISPPASAQPPIPPFIEATFSYPIFSRVSVANTDLFPLRQYTMTRFSRGTSASTLLSRLPRGMNTAPGMCPRFHSFCSRQSTKTVSGPAERNASSALTSRTFARTSSRSSSPVLMVTAPSDRRKRHSYESPSGHVQCHGVRVHLCHSAEGNRPLLGYVADGRSCKTRDARFISRFGDYVVDRSVVGRDCVLRKTEISSDYRGAAAEGAGKEELPHHPVHSVHRLVDVLEDENRPLEVHRPGSAHQRSDEREIASGKTTAGAAGAQCSPFRCTAARIALFDDSPAQRVAREGSELSACGRTVKRHDPALPVDGRVQGSDVGKADQGSRIRAESCVVDVAKQSRRPVPAAHTPDAIYGIVGNGAVEVAEPRIVRPGEIPVHRRDIFAQHRDPFE